MTNAEKFKEIFGIEFEQMTTGLLKQEYVRKLKEYRYVLRERKNSIFYGDGIYEKGFVFATSKKQAREKIVKDLNKRGAYYGNHLPSALIITEATADTPQTGERSE